MARRTIPPDAVILDLWDAGNDTLDIAQKLLRDGHYVVVTESYVYNTLARLAGCAREPLRVQKARAMG